MDHLKLRLVLKVSGCLAKVENFGSNVRYDEFSLEISVLGHPSQTISTKVH